MSTIFCLTYLHREHSIKTDADTLKICEPRKLDLALRKSDFAKWELEKSQKEISVITSLILTQNSRTKTTPTKTESHLKEFTPIQKGKIGIWNLVGDNARGVFSSWSNIACAMGARKTKSVSPYLTLASILCNPKRTACDNTHCCSTQKFKRIGMTTDVSNSKSQLRISA